MFQFVDENYFECTPVPLWKRKLPLFNFDRLLEKKHEDIKTLTPIRPQNFSALFAFYRDREPALQWDPELTDLEEDIFYQTIMTFPSDKLAYNLPKSQVAEVAKSKRVKVYKPSGDFSVRTRLLVNLTESKTFELLNLKSSLAPKDENSAEIILKNERYAKMVKNHLESDSYADDCTQCFQNYMLDNYSDYRITGCADVGITCHSYHIADEYDAVHVAAAKQNKRDAEDAAARLLAERTRQEYTEQSWKSSDDENEDGDEDEIALYDTKANLAQYFVDKDDDEVLRASIMERASEDEVSCTSDEDEFTLKETLDTVYYKRTKMGKRKGPKMYPDISFSVISMQRAIGMNYSQERQADMRGFSVPAKKEMKMLYVAADKGAGGDTSISIKDEAEQERVAKQLMEQYKKLEEMEKNGEDDEDSKPTETTFSAMLHGIATPQKSRVEAALAEEMAAQSMKTEVVVESVDAEEEEHDEFDHIDEKWMDDDYYDETLEQTDAASMAGESAGQTVLTDQQDTAAESGPESSRMDRTDSHAVEMDSKDSKTMTETGAESGMQTSEPKSGTDAEMGMDDDNLGKIWCEWGESSNKSVEKELQENHYEWEYIPDSATEDDCEEIVSSDEDRKRRRPAQHKQQYMFTRRRPKKKRISHEKDPASSSSPPESDDATQHTDGSVVDIETQTRMSSHRGGKLRKSGRKTDTGLKSQTISYLTDEDEDSEDFDLNIKDGPDMSTGPSLKKFWTFKSPDTAGKEVMDIALHKNGNIIAVAYGTFRFGMEHAEGMVCIWNAKNIRDPERVYKVDSPVTSIGFAYMTPYVLAVGMLDGNIILFDSREDDEIVLGSTASLEEKHLGPIWQLCWLTEEDATSDGILRECLLSLGDDGIIRKWRLTKGLESHIAMKITRSPMQIPGRREKRSESLITSRSTAYTLCFFPDSTDTFLIGTEEGFIHKCASAYKDQYVTTFVGHTGPVYKVQFSTFDKQVFVSCGGDWTMRIWKTDFSTPLLTMHTGHRTIFDVACSLYSSTVFICATEHHVEVWDLSMNTLEPVVNYKPAFSVGLRRVAFSGYLNTVIIGDDEGTVNIYGLRRFATPPDTKRAQIDQLLEALMPGYTKRRAQEGARNDSPTDVEKNKGSTPVGQHKSPHHDNMAFRL